MSELSVGAIGRAEMIVGTNDTAPRVGSGRIAVLATPMMINLSDLKIPVFSCDPT